MESLAQFSLSRLHLLSQKLRSPPACPPQPSPSPAVTIFPAHTEAPSPVPPLENNTGGSEPQRSCSTSKPVTLSQGFHKAHCLSPSRYTPISFPGWPSPTGSPTPTPSPAPPIRDLTPSPSLSLRSTTPSPRPGSGISDCSDREGDRRAGREGGQPFDTLDRGVMDTHAEMCSPAQLRQQSEELYAVIDEILANSNPPNNSTLPKSLGRIFMQPAPIYRCGKKADGSQTDEARVIRPMTAIPRLTVENEEEFYPNPFKLSVGKQKLTDSKKVENMNPEEARRGFFTSLKSETTREERKPGRRSPFSLCDLQITEPEDLITPPVKDASASFSPTEGRMGAVETHI
ncbi:hypothetical protein INR49_021650 [Caranx melampygus]|nr:hypothetical protein INR49_021650 [Caranx melampygus]